jgi:heat shock protein HtpX
LAARHNFEKDAGLTARMTFTMFLLFALYAGFVAVLLLFKTPVAIVGAIAGVVLVVQYFASDRIALWGMHAQIVTREQAPTLHGVVDRLCAMANMKKPRVAIANTDVPNAFATGRNQKHAVVCATTGILRRLNEQELEAVLAHELSHVAHRDVAVMTIASFLGIIAGFMTRIFFWFGAIFDDRSSYGALAEMVGLLISAVVYAISFLLIRALSRYRELAADRSGAILIGQPRLLAVALQKVTGEMARIPTRDLRSSEHFNAFFFTPARGKGLSLSTLFSTHPTLQKRLDQLAKLEVEMGKAQ